MIVSVLAFILVQPAQAQSTEESLRNWEIFLRFQERTGSGLYAFLIEHPNWPKAKELQLRFERSKPDLSSNQILTFYKDLKPISYDGMVLYLSALPETRAKEAVKNWWQDADLSSKEQSSFIRIYGHLLTPEQLEARFNTALFNKKYTNARALAATLGKGYSTLAEARIALSEGARSADRLINSIPAHLQNDPGLLYERLRFRRKKDLDAGAAQILLSRPDPARVYNPDKWWAEQAIIARRYLQKRDYKTAYRIASNHFQTKPQTVAEAEWLSGWLALRFLNDPYKGFQHFDKMYKTVRTPLSKGRAAYWAGRASQDLNYPDIARQWYSVAARYNTTFYGQLAAKKLGNQAVNYTSLPPTPTSESKAQFDSNSLVQALRVLYRRHDLKNLRLFMVALRKDLNDPLQFRHAIDLAKSFNRTNDAVELSKEAGKKGYYMGTLAYPDYSNWLKGERDVEWSFVHAIIRQESAFDPQAKSPAGALGLMQLLITTAHEVALKEGVTVSRSALLDNPRLNVRLGTAYLERMLRRFDGSYILAAAAYNAGPGRVSGWVQEFGDPRRSKDIIDWIEGIPIEETRNYVQRILEATLVYRSILKNQPSGFANANPLPLQKN